MSGEKLSLYNTRFVYNYLTSILPPTLAVPIQQLIQHWVKYHGVEWTVGRIKDLRQQRLHYEVDSDLTLVRSHSDRTPCGAFRPLWRMDLQQALRVLMIYTIEVLDKETPKQMLKFLKGVESPPWNLEYPLDNMGIRIKRSYYYVHPYQWISSRTRSCPNLRVDVDGEIRTISVRESSCTFDDMTMPFIHPLISSHVSNFVDAYAGALWLHPSDLTDCCLYSVGVSIRPPPTDKLPVGKIGFIQEKGAKLRAVANPFRVFQAVLTPLGNALFDILKTLPWDCTYNQLNGVRFVQESLSLGKEVHSIDLSSATDTFPLKIQLELVRSIIIASSLQDNNQGVQGKNKHRKPEGEIPKAGRGPYYLRQRSADLLEGLNIFEVIARGDWSLGTAKTKGQVKWTKGQPLGLYPSFAMFALTHGILLRNIEKKLGVTNTFRVLGDDVVINDSNVARQYLIDLDYLGCEVSPSKTITSNKLGEFAGKTITAAGALPVGKFRPYSPSDVLGPLASLGFPGIKLIPSSIRTKMLALAAAPEPVGLGMNPEGYPLELRMPPDLIHWWYSVDSPMPTYESLSHRDLQWRHDIVWKSLHWVSRAYVSTVGETEWPIETGLYIPLPFDRKVSFEKIEVDHVRAVNRSRIFPEDIYFDLNTASPLNRGRPISDTSAPMRTALGRVYQYFREYRKVK